LASEDITGIFGRKNGGLKKMENLMKWMNLVKMEGIGKWGPGEMEDLVKWRT
jgi:hypothetical protein